MTLITDPDVLAQGVEVVITASAKTIQLVVAGDLTTDGITLQCLYSFCKEEWKSDSNLIKYPFPFTAITAEQFELIDGWDFADATTRGLIRTGGWALKDSGGVSQEEYACIISLGTIGTGGQVYYQQAVSAASTNMLLTGACNQAVKVYGDGTHGNFDYRSYFKLFVREYAKTYAMSQLSDIGVTTMTYQCYRFPLSNSDDLSIEDTDANVIGKTPYFGSIVRTAADGVGNGTTTFTSATGTFEAGDVGKFLCIAAGAAMGIYKIATRVSGTEITTDVAVPTATGVTYTVNAVGMSITWYATPQSKSIGGTSYDFHAIIDGNQGTAEQIYTFIRFMLRQNRDIDESGTLTKTGKTTNDIIEFVGTDLKTKLYTTAEGTFIEDFQEEDTNRIYFADDDFVAPTYVQYPFVAVLTLSFGQNLQDDDDAIYRVFFTNDEAGSDLGYDYGTANAILIDTNNAFATTYRARNGSNVATITTTLAHGLAVGDCVKVAGLGGTGYNGNHVVTGVTTYTFTYANTGSEEAETADTGGTITQQMGGKVNNEASIILTFAYDSNVQRGAGSDGEDAPITAISLGLETAQFVEATATITRSTSNIASLVAPLERNYANA